ncbi:MAG TPA: iron-sulfur cluster repair di-iron protein [Flavipsychrobacter sp.]|nr:iron-sulfur cluster repair di-iron protein [Flavipsychrobacter sp.]
MNNVFIDVTVLEPRMKHPTIFDAFDNVAEGAAVVIHNDHDPKPLYYQLLGERGNCFSWTYLSNGPEIWEVEIKKNAKNSETVGEIAAKDMRKAELLKKLGIDFCCGGKKSLEEACQEKGLDVLRVKNELEEAEKKPQTGPQLDFNTFNLSFLADYIVNVHHGYVTQYAPIIEDLAHKVAGHHGANNPFLVEVYNKFNELRCELTTHMKKEEQILFPSIKLLENGGTKIGFETINDPIFMMERDHDIAGELMRDIRQLTSDFQVPENSCNSIKMLYYKLEEFENDLLQHIHLENNILFPKAMAMEKK